MAKQNIKLTAVVAELDEKAVAEEQKRQYEERIGRLQSLGSMLSKQRDEAVSARIQSGVEDDWLEDEEHYEGIDDANRDLYRNRGKPLSPDGGSDKKKDQVVRSRVFLNITRPYVDAAAAKVADMLLPTDDQNWGIDPTPIPTLIKNKASQSPLLKPDGQPAMTQGPDGQPKQMTVGEHAKQIIDMAKTASEEAETRIDDWLTESNYNHETRKVIEKCARLGTGIIKGPYPTARNYTSISKEGGLTAVKRELKMYPESRCIDPWDFYPDPACGNDIHRGSFTFEKDRLTKRGVEDLLKDDSYIAEMVHKCLEEGPQKQHLETKDNERKSLNVDGNSQYEVWYYTGYISPEDMEAAGCPCQGTESIAAIVVMINDYVVKAAINPLDSGEFPYDVMTWQERDGHWTGIGVSRQIRTPQRILNAGVRNVMDNAGLMSGPQIVMKRSMIEPADGQWALSPRKLWYMLEDATGTVAEAFAAINIPAMQNELFAIIQFAIKMAEDVTGLPMLLQGQQGAAPETVGGMQMLNNNASTVMRRIARTYDDKITEPHIRRYYEWLLLDPDVPESEKGDYKIVARGSSALVERDIQNQTIAQMGAMVVNPAFGIDPKRWVAEYFKSQRLDPRSFQFTEEELAKLAEQQAQNPPPEDPSIIRAKAQVESTKIRSDAMVSVSQADVQEKQTQRELDLQEAREERQFKLQMAQLNRDTEILKLSNTEKLSIDKIKAQLAEVAIKEKNKREMFTAEKNLAIQTGSGI
ncbi:MAG TPA: hypothetical protein VES38_06790 [Methylotenera sp.]|nr:hypothetical protein [Methylotenera sp.]